MILPGKAKKLVSDATAAVKDAADKTGGFVRLAIGLAAGALLVACVALVIAARGRRVASA